MKTEEASKQVTKVTKKVKKETMKTEEKVKKETTEKLPAEEPIPKEESSEKISTPLFYFPEGLVDTIYSLTLYSFTHNVYIGVINDGKMSPLYKAIISDNLIEVMKELMKADVKLNTRVWNYSFDCYTEGDALGWSLLRFSSLEMIETLINHGANLNTLIIAGSISDPNEPRLQVSDVTKYNLLEWLDDTLDNAEEYGFKDFREFWIEYCGRGPTKKWFKSVKKLLQKCAV